MFHVTKAHIYHLMTMQSASDPFPFFTLEYIHTHTYRHTAAIPLFGDNCVSGRRVAQRNDTFNFGLCSVFQNTNVVYFSITIFRKSRTQ